MSAQPPPTQSACQFCRGARVTVILNSPIPCGRCNGSGVEPVDVPVRGAYPADWAAPVLRDELEDLGETFDDLCGKLDVIERLARGAIAPWTDDLERAAASVRESLSSLYRVITDA